MLVEDLGYLLTDKISGTPSSILRISYLSRCQLVIIASKVALGINHKPSLFCRQVL